MAGSRKAKILFLARNGGEPKIPSRNLMKLIFHNNRVVAIYFLCFTRLKIKPLANSDWAEKTKGSWTHENT